MAVTDRDVRIALRLMPGEVVAVLGPNGAGKSTLLSLIAGLVRPDTGTLTLDGTPLVDTSRRIFVPPHRRGVVLLAQQALLFPHLTARGNVAFGPRSTGSTREDADRAALQWLAAVDATEFADRRPAQLSGGQAQRIAVARALAADPHLLLLDEPMAALDIAVAPALRQLLRRVLRESARTALLVTHDILDALALAERTVVIEGGRIVEDGPTRDVLARPRSAFAARLAGINLIPGTATVTGLTTAAGTPVRGRPDADLVVGEPAVALFNPNAVAVHLDPPTGSPRNHFPVTIAEIEPRGADVRVRATENPDGTAGLFADLTAASVADLDLVPGQRVHFAVKATEVGVHPRATADGEPRRSIR
ncbi:MAG: ABC transporter ATP-binding protein [Nakamurella sp.]